MIDQVIYKARNIVKYYPGVKAVDDVSLDIFKGEIHSVVGENGAGKSTLMNIFAGVCGPDSGVLEYENKKVMFSSPKDAQSLGISMIHQELSLSNTLSVAENIFQARLPKGRFRLIDKRALINKSQQLMKTVGLENVSPLVSVNDINASQQQQVEIAKALALNAKVLILDEPTSSLTTNEAEKLFAIMHDLKKQGITMINISHKIDEIMYISDRITVLRDGKLIKTLNKNETSIEEIITLMVGRKYSEQYSRQCYLNNYSKLKPVLEVEDLSVGKKVKKASFKLYPGEVLGIYGLVGAGRSEVLQSIFGADSFKTGSIKINGENVKIDSTRTAIKHGMGLVPEGRKKQGIFAKMSVKTNVSIVNIGTIRNKFKLLNLKREVIKVKKYVDSLKIKTPTVNQTIVNLSGGNQQKTILARWLMNEPKILFLDEPTQGIDVGTKTEIYKIIDSLASLGISIIMVSSEMYENIVLCDRVLIMHEGKITGEIMHNEITEESMMMYASNQK